MSNMSYCRFENTVIDMQKCIDVLENNCWDLERMFEDVSSKQEARAINQFITLCREVAEASFISQDSE